MTECDKRKSHINSKHHMIYLSSNNIRLTVTKTFTTLHYTTLVDTSLLLFKLHPTTLHRLIWLNCAHFSHLNQQSGVDRCWASHFPIFTPLLHSPPSPRAAFLRLVIPRSLNQYFLTAGPRPGTGPWLQLYRATRISSGICHCSFLSNFHE